MSLDICREIESSTRDRTAEESVLVSVKDAKEACRESIQRPSRVPFLYCSDRHYTAIKDTQCALIADLQ